jgi:hypothetical protein
MLSVGYSRSTFRMVALSSADHLHLGCVFAVVVAVV